LEYGQSVLVSSSVRWQWQELQDRHGSPGGIFRGFFYLIAFAMPVRRFRRPGLSRQEALHFFGPN
jgi:hypothetical protein